MFNIMEHKYRLKVNEGFEFEFGDDALTILDIVEQQEGDIHLIQNNTGYHVQILEKQPHKKEYAVIVNGNSYQIQIDTPLDLLIEQLGFELSSSGKVSTIEAPMPGLILEVAVSEGQEVSEGDTLLILEAMKMENVITSPVDGTIKSISVGQGDAVDKKQVLLTFE